MAAGPSSLRASVEASLWPLVESLLSAHDLAGLAVAVVRQQEVVSRGFGVRDVGTGAPVTSETMFHVASVSKPFVATAVASLATPRHVRAPEFDLDAPITSWVPEFTLADGRAGEVTARGLLSHSSGLPDVSEYDWHAPELDDDALSRFAAGLSDWRLKSDPGSAFSYSNAGFELLGLLLSRLTGTSFENAMRQVLLVPLGMQQSTFLRGDVPLDLAASPHVGLPLSVPEDAYPYTRRHAPSSSLHSNLVEMCRWMSAHFVTPEVPARERTLDPGLLELLSQPVVHVGDPPWEQSMGLGWAVGSYRGHRTLSHAGADPGFGARLVLVPARRTGVVVLANSNTAPTWAIVEAALDLALDGPTPAGALSTSSGESGHWVPALSTLLPPVVGPVARSLAEDGPDAASATYFRLRAADPVEHDFDDDEFEKAVWGAIELHRTHLVWPLLDLWTTLRPESSTAWTMTGWAHQVDQRLELAASHLRRAIELDPQNGDAALLLSNLAPADPTS